MATGPNEDEYVSRLHEYQRESGALKGESNQR
jgi:hypothetical protein